MTQTQISTPYDSARLLFGGRALTWMNSYDAARLASYKIYEDVYFNNPETFSLVMRGTNEHPIYVPSGKIIVNTMNRYVCRNMSIIPDPEYGTEQDRLAMNAVFKDLFKRERFRSKFNSNKLFGIIRGDACWYIQADPNKPEGSRVSIDTIDPGSVFRIEEEEDPDVLLGYDIIETILVKDKEVLKRQRYLKPGHPDHISPESGFITYQVDTLELENWEDPDEAKKVPGGESIPPFVIEGITKLPIYHHKNFDQPDNPWGSSELRGLETLIAGVNQTISDEDLALAISGLGIYVTDAGAPVDDQDNEVPWNLGPAEVVEVGTGKKFERVQGITSVDPSLKHADWLQEQAFRTSGASDVAQGRVEVQMAESGIALALRMGPILDEAGIKETLITECIDQMLFDLREWLLVYEGWDFGEHDPFNPGSSTAMMVKTGDKLPEDKEARRKALMEGYNAIPAIFSATFVRAELRRMGWDIPDDETIMDQISTEATFFSDVTSSDEYNNRLSVEAGDEDEEME